jgi:hypothetical protein
MRSDRTGEATPGGSRGGKGLTQGEQPLGRGSDTEPKYRVDPNNGCCDAQTLPFGDVLECLLDLREDL